MVPPHRSNAGAGVEKLQSAPNFISEESVIINNACLFSSILSVSRKEMAS